MNRCSIAWMGPLLLLLTLVGVHSVYWLTRFLWLASAEPRHQGLWMMRIYIWMAISLFIGVFWILLLVLVRWKEGQAN